MGRWYVQTATTRRLAKPASVWLWLDATGPARMGPLPEAWRGKQALVVLGESDSRRVEIPAESLVEHRREHTTGAVVPAFYTAP